MKIIFSNYKLGAGVATDLVNTSPVVQTTRGELLTDRAALARFLAEHDVRPDALADGRQPDDADLEDVRSLRGEIRAILEADAEEHVVEAASALVRRGGIGPSLYRDAEDRWQWYVATSPDTSVADELAVLMGTGLLGALRTLSHDRFRRCASPVCEGMFVDTSKAGRRRYCMPEVCGNRLNVASHRARRLESARRRPDSRGTGDTDSG
ncbi:CGNR zinc finger domain-containing protein [Streptomyces scopuliridis]|uniref:CGNR zinc finger domain-containing protein n=1 Tax=Streptomyces scopuliridis TaxID=452529 RepID=A0ACD4ZEH5_9ACTN|nr:CGNR zinc finger domain-containing protein [Streptomyces scopuliridis]WSB31956.1 CGNR zinc finger domain-containing protein [Streptomyces scopuliridis]WSB96216.1 CGNR zinc finger domain-containing protein [Streptomyces scopuliridis]WSC10078.1 CGNR zinc finger domain-containing protein [Streptomyces scopuliridis]